MTEEFIAPRLSPLGRFTSDDLLDLHSAIGPDKSLLRLERIFPLIMDERIPSQERIELTREGLELVGRLENEFFSQIGLVRFALPALNETIRNKRTALSCDVLNNLPKILVPFEEALAMGVEVLTAHGVTEQNAGLVVKSLLDADSKGHHTHGINRLLTYILAVREGRILPNGEFRVELETGGFAQVKGGYNFGQVAMQQALEYGLSQASKHVSFSLAGREINHVGRLEWYFRQAAIKGCTAIMFANVGGEGRLAPPGGLERRFGTNPISMGVPYKKDAVVFDCATSIVTEGICRIAFANGVEMPPNFLIDSQGNPTTDPAVLYTQPFGTILSAAGHKGYGMAMMMSMIIEILSGANPGESIPKATNGIYLNLIDTDRIAPVEQRDQLIEGWITRIKSSKTLSDQVKIYMPGEHGELRRQKAIQFGYPIPEKTWQDICQLRNDPNMDLSLYSG